MFANSRVGKFSRSDSRGAKGRCGGGRGGKKSDSGKGVSGDLDDVLPVVVTSYDICMRDQRFLENRKWRFLVVDEGHRIKNLNCKLVR